MAQRTATITQIRYSKRNSRGENKWKDLGALPDGGDFLTFVMGLWNGLAPGALHDRSKQRYCEPEGCIARGRSLTLAAKAGVYGDPGSVRDVQTGTERLSHNGDLTNAVPLRVSLFVPKRGTSALLFIEHIQGIAFGAQLLEYVKERWKERYAEWTLNTQTLTRPDAWLKNAQLEAVHAEVYKHKTNLEDNGVASEIGILRTTLEPMKGSRYFPEKILKRLQDGTIDKSELLGLQEEPDSVKVTLGDGDQSRTFVIGKDKTPAVRLLVTDYGQPALDDDRFRGWCGAEVASHFKAVGTDWNASMLDGDWSKEALAMKVERKDGQ